MVAPGGGFAEPGELIAYRIQALEGRQILSALRDSRLTCCRLPRVSQSSWPKTPGATIGRHSVTASNTTETGLRRIRLSFFTQLQKRAAMILQMSHMNVVFIDFVK
jgi:hypothetical protein